MTAVDTIMETTDTTTTPNYRIPAVGGLAFVALAAAQNIIRATLLPATGASPAQVVSSFDHHGLAVRTLIGAFVLAGVSLAVFLGGLWSRIGHGPARAWAQTGLVGAIGTFAIFPIVVSCEVALLVLVGTAAPDAGAIQTLWILHNALFVVNSVALAVAVVGLGIASAAAQLVPRPMATVGVVAAAALGMAVIAAPQIASGGAQPLFAAMGLGYLAWLALVVAAAIGLLRGARGKPATNG